MKAEAGKKVVYNLKKGEEDKPRDGWTTWSRTLPSFLALVLSLFSLASCLYLNGKNRELQDRMGTIEHGQSGEIFHVPGLSVDQLSSIVQEKVDRLLSQVWIISLLFFFFSSITLYKPLMQ